MSEAPTAAPAIGTLGGANPDPLASSRAMAETMAALKAEAVQVAAGAQNSDAGARRYAVPRETAEAWADFWITLGAHVLPLRKDGSKKPLNPGWPDARAMTRDDIVTWLSQGGGIGINLGKTGWAVLDADNAKATELFRSAGLVRTVITANAQVPDHPKGKTGGGQFILRAPVGIDPDTLHSRPFDLPCGAKGDMLGGRRYIVAAPTRLDEAGGRSYMPDPEGIWVTGAVMQHVGPWAVDPHAVGNIGALEPLRGLLGPKQPHERVYDEAGEWRTPRQQQIDEKISWAQVFDCEEGRKFTVETTDSCGCDVYTYAGQTSKDGRGLTAHDGCSWGWYGATWSGTARQHFDLPLSTDRLRIAARLRRLDTDGEVALGRTWGVEFGGLTAFVDTLDAAAESYEERAANPEQCTGTVVEPDPQAVVETTCLNPLTHRVAGTGGWREVTTDREYWLRQAAQCRSVAEQVRTQATPQAGGETFLSGQVIGAKVPAQPVKPATVPPAAAGEQGVIVDAETVEVPADPAAATGTDLAPDDAIEGELVGGVDTTELEQVIRDLRAKIEVIEDQMLALGVPAVQRIWNYAESQGVYPHGLTCALLPRAVSSVPPNVVLPARNRMTSDKVMGQGVNIYTVNVAVSSAGKGETENAADAAIPLQRGVKRVGLGTAEYYAKELRGVEDGEPVIHTTSLLGVIDEMDQLNAYLSQPGNKLPGFLTMAYQNGQGGQGTSNKDNSSILPKHGSRIGFMVNSQPEKMVVLGQHNSIGAEARFIAGNTGLIHPDRVGPLYGLAVAPVMADQSAQPWYHTGHVADPPIPCQQPQSARAAAGAVPDITNIGSHRNEDGEEVKGHVGWDDAPPIWVTLPPKAEAALKESHRVSAELAADPTMALRAAVSAHRVVTILHASVGFAVLDGGYSPTDEQWEAAELLVAGSDLVKEMCRAYIELKDQTEAFKAGKVKGAGNAGSRAAEAAITTSGMHSAKNAILDRLLRAGGSAKPSQIRKGVTAKQLAEKDKAAEGVTGAFGGLSKSQKEFMMPAFAVLEREKKAHLATDGRWVLGPDTAQIAA